MNLSFEKTKKECGFIADQVNIIFPDLTLTFIPYHTGQRKEAIALLEDEILEHSAGKYTLELLEQEQKDENSHFVGMAASVKKGFLSIKTEYEFQATITLSIDKYKNLEQMTADVYHNIWHAIETRRMKLKENSGKAKKDGIVRIRNTPILTSKSNIKADIFSATMMQSTGDEKSYEIFGQKRALEALKAIPDIQPELQPYLIAMETAKMTYESLPEDTKRFGNPVNTAIEMADDIGNMYDSEQIKQWWKYTTAAQEMAWRGVEKSVILNASINTGHNPHVKSIGMIISDITGIVPSDITISDNVHNSFLSIKENEEKHIKQIYETFDKVIKNGLNEKSAKPFYNEANSQNDRLTQGRIMGWCADALQKSAIAFEKAIETGSQPVQAAREVFDKHVDKTKWETLNKLSKMVIKERRIGYIITLEALTSMCHGYPELSLLMDSIQVTLNDPIYQERLEYIKSLTSSYAHATEIEQKTEPKMANDYVPVATAAATLTLGGSSTSSRARTNINSNEKVET